MVGNIKLGDIEFTFSGRKDGIHRQGLGFIMNKGVSKSCLGWESTNNWMLAAYFMTKKWRVLVLVVYVSVEVINGDSDELYLQQQG